MRTSKKFLKRSNFGAEKYNLKNLQKGFKGNLNSKMKESVNLKTSFGIIKSEEQREKE